MTDKNIHPTTEPHDLAQPEGTRVNKYISDSGFCPRKKADKLIKADRVTINDELCRLGTKVGPNDIVKVDDQVITPREKTNFKHVYIAYHKPVGVTCTASPDVENNIINAIAHHERIFPVGRLDKASEGLMILTTDGSIVNKILRAENAHDKEYRVTVDSPLDDSFVNNMSNGLPILGTITNPCTVVLESPTVFKITLNQGLNRQIRRMCKFLGFKVLRLERLRIMNIHLNDLPPNEWRDLTPAELNDIFNAVSQSVDSSEELQAKSVKL